MGGAESKVTQLNKKITNITTSVMMENSTDCPINVVQTQEIIATGNARITNVSMDQSAKINISCIAKQDVNMKLQAQMKQQIGNYLKNDVTAQTFGYSKSASDITNIVETNVSDHFSQKNLASMETALQQKQVLQAHDESTIKDVNMRQYASIIGKLVNDNTTGISREIREDTAISNKALAKTTSALDSTMTGVNNILGTMFTWSTGSIIMGIGCSCCCCLMAIVPAFITMLSKSSKNTTVTEQVGEGLKQIGKGVTKYLPQSTMGRILWMIGGSLLFVMCFFGYAYYVGNSIRQERNKEYQKEHSEVDANNDNAEALHYKDRLSKRPTVQLPYDELEKIEYRNRTRKMGALDNLIPPAAPITPMTAGYLPGTNKTVTY